MNNIRWANQDHIGICYDQSNTVVYIDSGPLYQSIINGQHGAIGEPIIISTEAEPLTDDELASIAKEKRQRLLLETDWTQLADVSQATKDLFAPYRQALRDVPQQSGFPQTIDWPVKP
jgi:hypothetical protein